MADRDPFFISLEGPSSDRNRPSDEDLLDSLNVFAQEKGNAPFTIRDWNNWPGKIRRHQTFVTRFGSWAGALKKIGISGVQQPHLSHTPESLLELIAKCWNEIGHKPMLKEVQEFAKSLDTSVHGYQFKSPFGSYPAAREKAWLKYGVEFDLDPNKKRQRISDQAIIDSIKTYARLKGNNYIMMREWNSWADKACSASHIRERFGWQEAMRLADLTGIGQKAVWSAEECVKFLEDCARHFGRFPSATDLKEFRKIKGRGPLGENCYTRIWGSLPKAREAVRQFHAKKITWEQLIAGSTEGKSGRGPISPRLRMEIFERDNYTCQNCGRSKTDYPDLELHLEHKKLVSEGGTNDPPNLRTWCKDCNLGRGNTDLGL